MAGTVSWASDWRGLLCFTGLFSFTGGQPDPGDNFPEGEDDSSAVQCSSVQCSTVQCIAVQCSVMQCSAVQCSN